MLDPKLLRDSPELVREAIAKKHLDVDLEAVLALDVSWRAGLQEVETLRARQKAANTAMAALPKGSPEFIAKVGEMKTVSNAVKEREAGMKEAEEKWRQAMLSLPNLPHASVPAGRTPEDNVIQALHGGHEEVRPHALPHWEIPGFDRLYDFARGAKVTGAGFPFFIGDGAKLVRALLNFFLDEDVRAGYTEVSPPIFVNAASATATGQLPDKEGQMYETTDRLFAVPTAEVPVTNFFRDEILEESALPVSRCAYTPCFRREAGSYGKDVRGLNRLHQFDKVELLKWVHPAASYDELEKLRDDAERLLQEIGIALSRAPHVRGRHGFCAGQKIRPRGLGGRTETLAGGLELLEFRGVPSPPGANSLPAQGHRQTRAGAHAQRFRPRGAPRARGAAREQSAGRRPGEDPGGVAAVFWQGIPQLCLRVDAARRLELADRAQPRYSPVVARKMPAEKKNQWSVAAEKLAAALPRARLHPAALAWLRAARGPQAVAFSGGADSLALLLLLWAHWPERRARLVALHFNHRLRGRAAEGDEAFCRKVCLALGVKFRVGRWRAARPGASEAEARDARFQFLEQTLRQLRTHSLYLGHQQDDIAETMLMRIARGSGAGGLAAPRPVQTMPGRRVNVRPLLRLKKTEIVAALRAAGVSWREDATNAGGDYFRNRVRRTVLPAWRRAAGDRDVLDGAALARELIEEDEAAIDRWLMEIAPWCGRGNKVLDLHRLAGRPRALWRRALHGWLLAHPAAARISRQGFEDLLAAVASARPTRRSLGVKGFAVIRRGRLEFERLK